MLNFDWLAGVSADTAKYIFYILFLLIAILVLLIPNSYIFLGLPQDQRHWWKNLKLWSILVLMCLAMVYYIF